jgi:transaldolase
VNITLLFSREQYVGPADAYMRGIERRIEAGRDPEVGSVASVFVSRWDAAVRDQVPEQLRGRLGLAVGLKIYQAHAELLSSERWLRLAYFGARPQRLLWGSTSTKDPSLSDTLYVEGLAAPHTITTMPESTLLAFADHGQVGEPMDADGGDADATLAQCASAGVDIHALGATLQCEGARKFANSWTDLLNRIGERVTVVKA